MKKILNIGSMKLPTTSATKGFGFIGKRGSGKSYGAAVLAEELYKTKIPFVVFDPIDVWWGLKVAADGKGKGLPVVVFGKEHADIQLDRTMGKKIAEAVVRDNISCIISTFGMNKTEMREVVADFSERLLQLNNTPRQVIIEEAHEFVPQRVQGAMARCFSAVEALLVMGRNRGIGVSLLNQRMATLNKDLLTQIDVLVAFRSVGPQDRKAFRDWVEVHNEENDEHFNEFMRSVPALKTGSAWIWSPEFLEKFELVKFRARETFHPDREKLGVTFKMPDIKQGDVQAFIDSFSKKPEQKQQEIKNFPRTRPGTGDGVALHKVEIERSRKMGYSEGYAQGEHDALIRAVKERDAFWRKEIEKEGASWRRLVNYLDSIHLQASNLFAGSKRPVLYLTGGQKIAAPKVERATVDQKAPDVRRGSSNDEPQNRNRDVSHEGVSSDDVSKPEQKILDAIAWMHAIGQEHPNKAAVALVARTRPTSGGYQNYLSKLRTRGLLDYPTPGDVALTPEGHRIAATPEINASTNKEFHKIILNTLTNPEQNVLRPLLETGEEISKEDLAPLTPYVHTSGGYQNLLSVLRTMGLIDYPRPNYVKAEAILFPFDS